MDKSTDNLVARWRALSVALPIALSLAIFAWKMLPSTDPLDAVWAAVLSVPLYAPLLGLWRLRRNTMRWATMCVMPYFVVGLTEAIADPQARVWAAITLALALAWFVALIALLRVSGARQAAA